MTPATILILAAVIAAEMPVRFTTEAKLPAHGGVRAAIEKRFELGDEEEVEVGRSKERRTLWSCADYLRLGEAQPLTVDITGQRHALSEMAHCRALGWLDSARPSKNSFLGDFELSAETPALLPAELRIDPASTDAKRRRRTKPWRSVEPGVRASISKPHVLHVEGRLDETFVREYGRGDVDGDGLEDVVVRTEGFLPGGTYQEHAAYALTRRAPGGPLVVVARWSGAY